MARFWRTAFGAFLVTIAVACLVRAGAYLVNGEVAAALVFGLGAVPFLLFGAARLYWARITRDD